MHASVSRRVVIGLSLGMAGFLGGIVASANLAPGAPLSVDDLPVAARQTVERFADGGHIVKVTRAKEDGLSIYQAIVETNGRTVEIQTTLDGRLFATEEKIAAATLPEPVATRVNDLFGPDSKVSAERAVVGLYEISGRKNAKSKKVEYLVNEAGAVFQEIRPGVFEKEAEESDEEDEKK